jgi:myo-inositol-1(or 4)-monophosphatase
MSLLVARSGRDVTEEVTEDLLAFAHRLADEARPLALRYFRQPLDVQIKADLSPVTLADQAIERHLRALILEHHPDHGLFGEEHGALATDREWIWVLDPIDGTKSFISGMPLFGTLIALLHFGKPVLGVVDHPALSERWVGVAGRGATYQGKPCKTRDCDHLSDAIVMTTSPDAYGDQASEDWQRFDKVSRRARLRRFGGDCYQYALLASGHIDVVMGANLEPYDFMPMVALVRSAGGCISNWKGEELTLSHTRERVLVSATERLHQEVLSMLNEPLEG